jgi:hypothetical protein
MFFRFRFQILNAVHYMINCYTRNIKYILNVKSLINNLVKGFFVPVSSKVSTKNFMAITFIIALSIFSVQGYAQTMTFSSTSPAVLPTVIGISSSKQPIYRGVITLSALGGNSTNLYNVTFTPTGSFVGGDISNYQFWWSKTDDLSTANQNAAAATVKASGGQVTISPYNPTFNESTTYYVWITADISSTATVGHTITVGALSTSDFSFSGATVTKSGIMYAGGTQTIASQQQFNSSGSFTVPDGVYSIQVEAWGAGGGGGGSTSSNKGGSGGGGGAYCVNTTAVTPGQVINYTVGAGGSGGYYGTGADGGSSSILALTANGGKGGAGNAGTAGTGGSASGGSTNTNGEAGTTGGASGGNGGNGGNGANGGIGNTDGQGDDGNAPGGGGGGGEAYYYWQRWGWRTNSYPGGSGGDGQVIITWIPSTITASITALGGFNYIYDFGPSALQLFTVSGDRLPANITIAASTNYEISVDGGATFTSTSVTVSKSSNTTVYVRLKAGLPVGSYNGESITLTSGTITKAITCSGFVSATAPSIVAAGGIDCSANTINLKSTYSAGVSNVYWTGPNSFYSTTQNPTITGATSVNEGTYTVTGSVLSGVNLITNGDFAAGDTGFTSEYTYWASGKSMSESRYSIVTLPSLIHTNFCSGCGDHTSGSGNQMVINGAGTEKTIWAPTQPIAVTPNTNYQFIYWVQTVVNNDDPSPSKLQLYANGDPAGSIYIANPKTGVWKQFIYNWNSGSNTTVNLQLKNKNFDTGGNDFALDDISFQPVVQISSSVKVTLSKAPSLLLVAAAANPVAAGTNVTFSTIPTNGGTAPTFQWYVNGSLVVGATSPTYSYVPLNNDNVTCVMTPVGACVSTPVTSNPIVIMTVNPTPNYWVGTTGTSWSVPANWSAGVVPKPGDDVIFATDANNGTGNAAKHDLFVDTNHSIGNLINQTANRKLVVTPAKILFVNQKITTNSADQILIQSVANQPNGSLIFPNATNVKATVEMYTKASLVTPITIDGTTYHYSWQYFGVPLSSVQADPTFYGSYVRRNDETVQDTYGKWISLNNSDNLTAFKGYEITQDVAKTIVFQGVLVNGDSPSLPLTYTYSSNAYDPGQNLLANPYTAAIDVRQMTFGPNTENTVYLYNTGSFGNWSSQNGETTYSESTNTPGQYLAIPKRLAGDMGIPNDIPSMSGFLVKVKGNTANLTDYITIKYSSVIKNVNPQRAPQSKSDKVYMQISLKGERFGDTMWLVNEPGTSHDFDNGWDGAKFSGAAGSPQLFAMEKSGNYQISTSDDLNNTYLGFQAGVDVEDTLTFKNENLELKYDGVYLVDLVENKVIDITKSGAQYMFKAESTPVPVKRFKITTEPYVKGAQDLTTQIKVFNDNDAVFVDNSSNQNGELYFYDLMGRFLKKEVFAPNSISSFPLFSISGVYIVKAVTATEKVSKQIIVK